MRRPAMLSLALVALLSMSAGLFSGCRDNLDDTITNACPDQAVFEQSVSPYLERRCGTLDCHGSIARPMRIFGRLGLRHPSEDNFSGGAATTAIERTANYTSVCGVDAEKMDESVQDFGNRAAELLIVTKARGTERHKGGRVVSEGDSADKCILGWLQGQDVAADCQAAIDDLND